MPQQNQEQNQQQRQSAGGTKTTQKQERLKLPLVMQLEIGKFFLSLVLYADVKNHKHTIVRMTFRCM